MPPLFPFVVRNIIYPIYRGFRGDRILTILEDLERNQWLPAEELEELQWVRLKEFLKQITVHVPYYRDIFEESGLGADDIQNPSDFQKLPFLTKDRIRSEGRRLMTKDPLRRGHPSSTGGSTGEPLNFYCDQSAGPVRRANTMRAYRWSGIDIGDRQAFFWGFSFDTSLKKRVKETVKNYFNNIMYLTTFDMSDVTMNEYNSRLGRFKPGLIVGYPSALTVFSEYCRRGNGAAAKPRAVVTSGERLFAHQRRIIEDAFSCPVFDRYGSREFANISNECEEHRGLHVFNDLFYVEIIHESGRPAQSGEVGEIVVTDFSNMYMPFLRYRTGDLAIPTARKCPCGRGFPLIDRIEGRTFDAIVTPEGKSIGGFFWTWLSRAVPGIYRFQIEQRDRGGVIFRIVPGPEWKDEFKVELEGKIKDNCGEAFRVKFDIVGEIPLSPSGKSKFILSNIEERLVIKSKIHKAHITDESPGKIDSLIIDEELLELGDIAPMEKILIVDNTNGARLETFAMRGERGGGRITAGGAVSKHIRAGDEVSIMAFTWSDDVRDTFSNILVDEKNKFERYLEDIAGEKI